MANVCVYCGSSPGDSPEFVQVAKSLGSIIASEGHRLIYGGGNVGLMGAVADSVLAHGGEVIGVIPERLVQKEVAHQNLTELISVSSMHQRKEKMAELADCFIALPGGIGTLEEIIEVFVWTQLGFHQKACGILNVEGFYDSLLGFLDRMEDSRFLKKEHKGHLLVGTEPEELISRLLSARIVEVDKWLDRSA